MCFYEFGTTEDEIGGEGATSLASALKENKTLATLILTGGLLFSFSRIQLFESQSNGSHPENHIEETGCSAIAEALKTNTTLIELVLNGLCFV